MSRVSPPKRLHFVLQRAFEEVFEPDYAPDAPLVRFVAYADRYRVFGWVRLRADRLTDLVNAHDELLLTEVEIEDLENGRLRSEDEVLIATRELVAVQAVGPRGDSALRRRTRSHAVAVQCGGYLIGGHLHAEPGADPLASIRQRPPLVPLTDAWIEYWSGERRTCQGVGTIVVNREAADWIRLVNEDDLLEGVLRAMPIGSSSGSA